VVYDLNVPAEWQELVILQNITQTSVGCHNRQTVTAVQLAPHQSATTDSWAGRYLLNVACNRPTLVYWNS